MTVIEYFERAMLTALSPAGRRGRLLIVTYHRVLPEPDSLLPDEPDVATFAAQMDVLRTYCTVLSLPEAVTRLQAGTLPQRAAAVTFDDGYANNLDVALPVLEQRGLTATIFVAVDAVRRGIMWNDLVIESVRASAGSMDLSAVESAPLDLGAIDRASAVGNLLSRMKYMPLEERWNRALQLFADNAGTAVPRLMLEESQLARIADRGHDVGAHTVHHPILRQLEPEEARREIVESRRWLAETSSAAPRSFAYPNGKPGRDYEQAHVAMVREAGFDLAVSTAWGCATRRSDVYQLPRCTSWELSSRRFAMRLAKNYCMHAA